jgi:hypothetical protein
MIAARIAITWAAIVAATGAAGTEIRRSDLVGTWDYVTTHNEFPDGSKKQLFGKRPKGRFILAADGTYNHIIMHERIGDLAFYKRVCLKREDRCTLAHYGSYEVDEARGAFTGRVASSSDPKLTGKDQLRVVQKLDGETLVYINMLSVASGNAQVYALLRRAQP